MSWIESHQSLSRHRKTIRVAKILKTDRVKVIGHLHELWWWAVDNADIEGRLHDISFEELAEAASWSKDGTVFTQALIDARFVDVDGPVLILHNWYRYAGKLAEKREKDRLRKKELPADSTGIPLEVARKSQAHTYIPTNIQTNKPEAKASMGAVAPKTRGVVPLTADERNQLKDRWAASVPDWEEVLMLALSHESHKKYPTNQLGYANNWLRRECDSRGGTVLPSTDKFRDSRVVAAAEKWRTGQ